MDVETAKEVLLTLPLNVFECLEPLHLANAVTTVLERLEELEAGNAKITAERTQAVSLFRREIASTTLRPSTDGKED